MTYSILQNIDFPQKNKGFYVHTKSIGSSLFS